MFACCLKPKTTNRPRLWAQAWKDNNIKAMGTRITLVQGQVRPLRAHTLYE